MKIIEKKDVILIGAGQMAIDYAKVLKSMDIIPIVVGRSEKSAENFEKEIGIPVSIGGIKKWVKENPVPTNFAIIAVTENKLGEVARILIENGYKNILLEKPGGLDFDDIKSVSEYAKNFNAKVLIGYNRRFYRSVIKAREIIEKDGGIKSITFEFTEWSHRLKDLKKEPGVKENWLLQNSTHVIDLAFFFAGKPKEIKSFSKGGLDWHPNGCIFTGAGITTKDVPFSYHANWAAPGRWWLEINTSQNRLIFRPMEKLHVTKLGTVSIEEIQLNDELDQKFKPGIYLQVKAYLEGDEENFTNIHQQVENLDYYDSIINGN